MPEVPNTKVIDRYKELLAIRTHDVIIRDAAIEILEAELALETERKEKFEKDHEAVKTALARANETIRLLQEKINETSREIIEGEVLDRKED